VLDGGGLSTPRPGRWTPGDQTHYTSYRRLCGPQNKPGQVRNIAPPPGFDSRTIVRVASRYAFLAHRVPGTHWIRRLCPRAGLDTVWMKQVNCPCRESNSNTSCVRCVVYYIPSELYRLLPNSPPPPPARTTPNVMPRAHFPPPIRLFN
jgi:hypothetical protein